MIIENITTSQDEVQQYLDRNKGLETVFSPSHKNYAVLFYDRIEGQYYDREQDMYLELEDLPFYGMRT